MNPKILILNSKLDPRPYFKDKGLGLDITYKDLDVTPPLVKEGTLTNSAGVTNILWSPDVTEYLRGIVEPNQYNFVIWCYPASKYPNNQSTGGKSYSYPHLYLGTHYATVRIDGNELAYAIHELHHLFGYHLNKLGYPVNDQMDACLINGEWKQYWKNDTPLDPDSNHSRTWASIEPYKAHLSDFAPVMKKGMKNRWVANLQIRMGYPMYTLLSNDGNFGSYTEKCVKDFQKKNGLVADGIVGVKTLSALETKKKVQIDIDLSKWELVPELEVKAKDFLKKCNEKGFNLEICQGRRTQAEQDAKYAQGRTTPGPIVTWTKKSKHVQGKAFDICFNDKDPFREKVKNYNWTPIGTIGQSIGLKWGVIQNGKRRDFGHFEL